MADYSVFGKKLTERQQISQQSSNGFELRHVDLNLANRVYRSFPDFPVNNEVLKEILDNFEDEKGALITPNKPYMSKTAIL